MLPPRLMAPLGAALLLAACNTKGTNPFQPPSPTVAIPASARLIFCSSAYTTRAGAPREIFASAADGAELTRLTFCNGETTSCDNVVVAFSGDKGRVTVVRIQTDTDSNGRLAPPDDAGLVTIDLRRGLQAPIVQPVRRVTDVDWSPTEDFVVFSARGTAAADEDLFSIQPNGTAESPLIADAAAIDRSLRIDPQGRFGLFERRAANGKSGIWGVVNGLFQFTAGGPGTEPLPGTPYIVGSDSAPDFSPDDRFAVFRRLTAATPAGLGSWDLVVLDLTTRAERVIVSGPLYRGAPDWGPSGIAFPEIENNQARLVVVDPDGGNRRVPITLAAGQQLSSVRWLP